MFTRKNSVIIYIHTAFNKVFHIHWPDCAPHWIDGFFRSGILCISSCDCNPDPVGLRLVIDIHSEPKQLPVLHQALGYWW